MRLAMDKNAKVIGGSLKGYLYAEYSDMVKVFGEPNMEHDGYKSDAVWCGYISGLTFTIYNYKDGKNYLGEEGLPIEKIKEWHIGGFEQGVVNLLTTYFNDKLNKIGVVK